MHAGLPLSFLNWAYVRQGVYFWAYGTPGVSIFGVFRTSLPIVGVIFGLLEATKMYKLFYVNITKDRLHDIYNAVDYYTNRGSYVFICFVEFSKSFDRVNCELLEIVNNSRAIFASSWRNRVTAVTLLCHILMMFYISDNIA